MDQCSWNNENVTCKKCLSNKSRTDKQAKTLAIYAFHARLHFQQAASQVFNY